MTLGCSVGNCKSGFGITDFWVAEVLGSKATPPRSDDDPRGMGRGAWDSVRQHKGCFVPFGTAVPEAWVVTSGAFRAGNRDRGQEPSRTARHQNDQQTEARAVNPAITPQRHLGREEALGRL